MEERIQKLLCAVCSRRSAERLITAGRVTVNGRIAQLGETADPDQDEVLLDGKPLPRSETKLYLMLNKPRGYVTTMSDERGRKTVRQLVDGCGARVYPVGRLDMDSEGLLILTNDGALANKLLHPGGEVEKTYQVLVAGPTDGATERLSSITDLDGERIRPAHVSLLHRTKEGAELSVTIHEGKKRQIRRMCEQCGLRVLRLRRIREDTLELGDLASGTWRFLSREEILSLRRLLQEKQENGSADHRN